MKILRRYAFFLILLPLFVLVHLEKELPGLIHYHFIYDRLLVLFLLPFLFTGLSYLFYKNWKSAALLGFALSAWAFFLGDIKNKLSEQFPEAIWSRYSFLFAISILLFFLIGIWIKRRKQNHSSTFFFLNILFLLFVLVDISMIYGGQVRGRYQMKETDLTPSANLADSSRPDIFYIIFDAYAASSTLRSEFDYDNSPFEQALTAKGFHVFPGSRSNYNYTAFSLSSVFHLQYMANADTVNKIHDREYLQALKTVQENTLVPFLAQEGYAIHNHSLFDIKGHPTTLTRSDKWGIRELYDQYNIFFKFTRDLNHQLPGWMTNPVMDDRFFVNEQKNRQVYDSLVYRDLLQSASYPGPRPRFIYAHFLTPHPPFHLDSLGRPIPEQEFDIKKGYVHQIARINRFISQLTDTLLKPRARPLVIILQGDHGYTTVTDKVLKKERMFPNLQAWYFSNRDYEKLPADLTNVNTFRILLNTWFKKDLPILQNEFYFIK
ncbi:MAG: sulfatase-like hydrolase/transferase [Chitinophagaceae bacterium]|nr:sulfatase-like hydrolase/transferase [Chitinophagaceae bacterium]